MIGSEVQVDDRGGKSGEDVREACHLQACPIYASGITRASPGLTKSLCLFFPQSVILRSLCNQPSNILFSTPNLIPFAMAPYIPEIPLAGWNCSCGYNNMTNVDKCTGTKADGSKCGKNKNTA